MNAEAIILAVTLALTIIGTGATLYGRLVKIETLQRQFDKTQKAHGRGLRSIFKRTSNLPAYRARIEALEDQVRQLLVAPTR